MDEKVRAKDSVQKQCRENSAEEADRRSYLVRQQQSDLLQEQEQVHEFTWQDRNLPQWMMAEISTASSSYRQKMLTRLKIGVSIGAGASGKHGV